jgi:hypothetical protein
MPVIGQNCAILEMKKKKKKKKKKTAVHSVQGRTENIYTDQF